MSFTYNGDAHVNEVMVEIPLLILLNALVVSILMIVRKILRFYLGVLQKSISLNLPASVMLVTKLKMTMVSHVSTKTNVFLLSMNIILD